MDDRLPVARLVKRLVKRLFGTFFGDRGYISQELAEDPFVTEGLHFITKLRKNQPLTMPVLGVSEAAS